jgi:hypothetical protein
MKNARSKRKSDFKKKKRRRLAQELSQREQEEQKEDDQEQEGQLGKNAQAVEGHIEEEPKVVQSAWIGEVGDLTAVPDPSQVILPTYIPVEVAEYFLPLTFAQPPKRHKGLRCAKCFYLLVRDTDFNLKNGQLWINVDNLPPAWEGFKIKVTHLT